MLGAVVNVLRSLPFIILALALIPLTRALVGTSLGWEAAVVPLSVGTIPFFARLVETAVRDVAPGKVEAARVMGSTRFTIQVQVLVREALPALVSATTVTVITLIGFSAMVGADAAPDVRVAFSAIGPRFPFAAFETHGLRPEGEFLFDAAIGFPTWVTRSGRAAAARSMATTSSSCCTSGFWA